MKDGQFVQTPRGRHKLHTILSVSIPALTAAAGLMVSDAAFAQAKIEQMIVTAQKRAQDIQSVPASISAFSGDSLQERQIKTVEGVLAATPNVFFAAGPGNTPAVMIRGVGPEGINATVDPSVGFHIDGVYQPRVYGVQGLMNDIDSVEVLRGPQGTLYGRNANAGVINFNTKRPTDTFEASGTIFGGSYKRYGARGYVSGPVISDKVELRVSGVVDRHDGWGHNTFTGARPEADYFSAGRVTVRVKPIEDVTADFIFGISKDHNTKDRYTFVGRGVPGSAVPNYAFIVANSNARFNTEPWTNSSDVPPEQTHLQKTATGVITWDIAPNITLKSTTGFQHGVDDTLVDVDTLSYPFLWTKIFARSSTFSQEFDFNVKLFDRLETVVGLYYLRDHNNAGTYVPFQRGFPSPSLAANAPTDKYLVSIVDFTAKSKAAFMDNTLSITDSLRLLLGIRRTLDEKVNYGTQYTAGPVTGSSGPCQVPTRLPDLDYHSTTGKAGVQYDFTPNVMGYVQWQNGFKTGGYNSSVCGQSFRPEKIRSWEAGIKSTLFDDTMSLNISAFKYRYQDIQLSRSIGTTQLVDNAGKANIQGIEVESVVNLTDDLRVDASLGWMHSEYQGYTSTNAQTGLSQNTDGNQLVKAPNLTLNFGVEYTMRLGNFGELRSRGEAAYRSLVYFTPFNEQMAKQDPYWVGNLLFTLTPDDCPYSFQAYVKNVTDKAYRIGDSSSALLGYSYGQWGDPRTFGVEATVKF